MTEQEWLAYDAPAPMLLYLRGKVSDRKLRLFALACARLALHLVKAECSLELAGLIERWADEPKDHALSVDLFYGRRSNLEFFQTLPHRSATRAAAEAVYEAAGPSAWAAAWQVTSGVCRALQVRQRGPVRSAAIQEATLLRHIVGNPFASTVFDPAWRTEGAVAIARVAYEDRRWDDLPFLADALEEAGCTDETILTHCRQPGDHVRGCWVLDLVLGRE